MPDLLDRRPIEASCSEDLDESLDDRPRIVADARRDFLVWIVPSDPSSTMSVKVPPMSTPTL